MRLALTYALLALIATAANIGAQDLAIRTYHGELAISLSVAAGTGVGLLVKYLLDKRYIFSFRAKDITNDGTTFVLYSLMGLVTTLLFWGLEFGFDHIFHTKQMRYVGGIAGLTIGYVAKYRLDKRFVFRCTAALPAGP
jgi:putative flippase GtrA